MKKRERGGTHRLKVCHGLCDSSGVLHHVLESSRRGNDKILATPLELLDSPPLVLSSEPEVDSVCHAVLGRQRRSLLGDLSGELSRGRDDERSNLVVGEVAVLGVASQQLETRLEGGREEGDRLSGSRSRLDQQVPLSTLLTVRLLLPYKLRQQAQHSGLNRRHTLEVEGRASEGRQRLGVNLVLQRRKWNSGDGRLLLLLYRKLLLKGFGGLLEDRSRGGDRSGRES